MNNAYILMLILTKTLINFIHEIECSIVLTDKIYPIRTIHARPHPIIAIRLPKVQFAF